MESLMHVEDLVLTLFCTASVSDLAVKSSLELVNLLQQAGSPFLLHKFVSYVGISS